MAYYLRGCCIPEEQDNYVETVAQDFLTLVKMCICPSTDIPTLRDSQDSAHRDNSKISQTNAQENDARMKLSDLELVVNPSCFGAFHHARRLTLKFKALLDDTRSSEPCANWQTSVHSTAFIVTQSSAQATIKPIHKMVSAGIHCLVNLLLELNEKDPHTCATALTSLLHLLNSMPVGELATEPKPVVNHLFHVLKQIRGGQCDEVTSLAGSCLLALCTAYGSTDLFIECATNFTSSLWMANTTDITAVASVSTRTQLASLCTPDNYLALYKHTIATLHSSDVIMDWSDSILGQQNVLDCLDMRPLLEKQKISLDGSLLGLACDGSFIYVMFSEGLVKIGSGFGQTKRGFVYAMNTHIKNHEDVWLSVSTGSIYLRRKHTTRLIVLDCTTLDEIGEVLLPTSMSHCFLCNDGAQFSMISVQDSTSQLAITPLNEDFVPQEEEQIKMVLTEPKFLVLNDDTHVDNAEIVRQFGGECVKGLLNFILTKQLAIALSKEGVCYLRGNGSGLNLADTGEKWQQVKTQEKIKQISLSPDERTLLLTSQAGRVYACTSQHFECVPQRQDMKGVNFFACPRPLKGYSNRTIKQAICNNDTIALVTENGKLFLHGKQSILCDQETKQVIGLEHVHIKQVAMGKMHTVVVTTQGQVYTFGGNNFGQCGRATCPPPSHVKDTDSEKSKADDDTLSDITNPLPGTSQAVDSAPVAKLCAPSAHLWKHEIATICVACGMCSARGFECMYSKGRSKGAPCGCGMGLSGCSKCGICRNCGKRYGASGSEIDTESDGHSFAFLTPYRILLKTPPDCAIVQVACGNYHTVLRTSSGAVITFGSNRHGQLGTGDKKRHIGPQVVQLPTGTLAKQVHSGNNHCVVVCQNGALCSFGKHHEGQLGRQGTAADGFTRPDFIEGFTANSKRHTTFVSALGNATIVRYEQSLLMTRNIFQGGIVATRDQYLIVPTNYKSLAVNTQFYVVKKSQAKMQPVLRTGSFLQSTRHHSFSLDSLHNVMWAYDSSCHKLSCFVPWVPKAQNDGFLKLLEHAEFAIPLAKQSYVEDTQLGINMLSCFYTLFADKIERVKKTTVSKHMHRPCKKVQRFQALGGCWGYSMQSVEAVEFRASHNICIVGFGLYGGRGQYTARMKLLKCSKEGHLEVVAEIEDCAYECPAKDYAQLNFSKPTFIKADQWYTAWVVINGSSSDCGSNGQSSVTNHQDGVTFEFRKSQLSNNGTSELNGQIPSIFYQFTVDDGAIANESQNKSQEDVPLSIDSRFFFSISPNCYVSLLKLIKLAVESALFPEMTKHNSLDMFEIEQAISIVLLCLKILGHFNILMYPVPGAQPSHEHKEFMPYIENMFQILIAIMDSIKCETTTQQNLVQYFLHECEKVFLQCFYIFFPCATLASNFMSLLMKNEARSECTMKAFVTGLCTLKSPLSILGYGPGIVESNEKYPGLTSVMRQSRKITTSNCQIDFTTMLQFFMDLLFHEFTNSHFDLKRCAGIFLANICQQLVWISNDEGKSCGNAKKILPTPSRFERISTTMNWLSDGTYPDAISFQVSKTGIFLHGIGIFTGLGTYSYSVELLVSQDFCSGGDNNWVIKEKSTGCITSDNMTSDMAHVKFTRPVMLRPDDLYSVRLQFKGNKTLSGEDGIKTVVGQNGVKFTFFPCHLSQNNTSINRGQIPILLYSCTDDATANPISSRVASDWLLLLVKHFATNAMEALDHTHAFTKEIVQFFVPRLFGYLDLFVEKNPIHTIDLINCFDELLDAISLSNDEKMRSIPGEMGMETLSTVMELRESDESSGLSLKTVKFPANNSFQVIEFDASSKLSQEVNVQIFAGPILQCHPIVKYSGAEMNKKLLLVPGNELVFVLESLTSKHGVTDNMQTSCVKCSLYTHKAELRNEKLWLELELANFCAKACQLVMQSSHRVAFHSRENFEININALEDEVFEVIRDHMTILSKGLHLIHHPTVHEIVAAKLPLNSTSTEMRFLHDFISASNRTTGGKLARWLMVEAYIDPCNCELLIELENLHSGQPVLVTAITKDQYGRISYNDQVQVEISVTDISHGQDKNIQAALEGGMGKENVLSVTYQPTFMNRARYTAITMMKALQEYSFEEIRLFKYNMKKDKQQVPVASHQDGSYTANWIPSRSGIFKLECRIDSFLLDHVQTVEVKNGKVSPKCKMAEQKSAPKLLTAVCQDVNTSGVRIRCKPCLSANQVGIIPPNVAIFFVDEIHNNDGTWLRLSDDSIAIFCPKIDEPRSAWCLQFHKHINRILLSKIFDGSSKQDENLVRQSIIVACDEFYCLCKKENLVGAPIRILPYKSSKAIGHIDTCDVLHSVGWVQNIEGIWIQLDRHILSKLLPHGHNVNNESSIDGYCFVQENTNEECFFERVFSASMSLICSPSNHNSPLSASHMEKSILRQVSTQTSPNDEYAKMGKLAVFNNKLRHEFHNRLKPTVKVPPQNMKNNKHIPKAMEAAVADCIRSVFAAVLWHERLVNDCIACAAYLKFHTELQKLQFRNEVPVSDMLNSLAEFNVPVSLQMLLKLWKEISCAVVSIIHKHLILPSPSMLLRTTASDRKSSLPHSQLYFCELCENWLPALVTGHMKQNHPGCGRHAGGKGYNSLGKLTSGWTGNCGDGGTSSLTWYLMCEKCRLHYLQKTESQKQKVRKLRARSFRSSNGNAEPYKILKANAMFILQLNNTDQSPCGDRKISAQKDSEKLQKSTPNNWMLDFPQNPVMFGQSVQHSINSTDSSRKYSKPLVDAIAPACEKDLGPYSSDPGPKRSCTDDNVSLPTSEPLAQAYPFTSITNTRATSILLACESKSVLSSPSDALQSAIQIVKENSSVHNTCKRPVMAFVIQHHNLTHLYDAVYLATARSIIYEKAFHILAWLLENISNHISVIDVLESLISALTIFDEKNSSKLLLHPLRSAFLAGPSRIPMIKNFHKLLMLALQFLKNHRTTHVDVLPYCLHAWMFNFTSEDQELILKADVIKIVNSILSQWNDEHNNVTDTTTDHAQTIEVEQLKDVNGFCTIALPSQMEMVPCVIDGNLETFWESGDTDRNRIKDIRISKSDQNVKIFVISIFIDNMRDANYAVETVLFMENVEKSLQNPVKHFVINHSFIGWLKCSVTENCSSMTIQMKGFGTSIRLRQLQVLGISHKQQDEHFSLVKHSPSMLLQFNGMQMGAFELFQLIASFAFGDNSMQDGELQQQVFNTLFGKSQPLTLQSYIYTQIISALEREIHMLKERLKRNYSYCCGLLSMLQQISCSQMNAILCKNPSILTSISELILFSSQIVQVQAIEVLECIITAFDAKTISRPMLENLLMAIVKAASFQLRSIPVDLSRTITAIQCLSNDSNVAWHLNKVTTLEMAQYLRKFLSSLACGKFGDQWASEVKNALVEHIVSLATTNDFFKDVDFCLQRKTLWLMVAAASVVEDEKWLHASVTWQQVVTNCNEKAVFCENHDDSTTIAMIFCEFCQLHLCTDCSIVLHLNRASRMHTLTQLFSAGNCLQLTIHETCCRLKTSRFTILMDYSTLNGLIDFRKDLQFKPAQAVVNAQQKKCRFCGFNEAIGMQEVCEERECREKMAMACTKTLPCGHLCGGVVKEISCLACLRCHDDPDLHQDYEDICVICFTDTLASAPCIKLQCNHVVHYLCCSTVILKRWPGARITFGFTLCPVCKAAIEHDSLKELLAPLVQLKDDICKKALTRLTYDGLSNCKQLTNPSSPFFNDPTGYSMNLYAYYQCYKCQRAYFGGEAQCQALNNVDYDPSELLCGACSNVAQAQVCPRHGTEYLEYKCRYCCSVAVFFCFGTTHFCASCHDDFQRIIKTPLQQLPGCPTGPRLTQLDPPEGPCPLKIQHPPTGQEFALGCGVCRNLTTF